MSKLPAHKNPQLTPVKLAPIKRGAIAVATLGLSYLVLSMTWSLPQPTGSSAGLRVDWAIAQAQSWWDELWKKVPKRGGSGSPFCVLWPKPEDSQLSTTFSPTPLFIWKNSKAVVAQQVQVFEINKNQESQLIWETRVEPNQQQIRYPAPQNTGEGKSAKKPLKSGQAYEFKVIYRYMDEPIPQKPLDKWPKISPIRFRVVASPAKTRANFPNNDQGYFNYLNYLLALVDSEGDQLYSGDVFQAAFDPPNPFSNKIRANDACSTHPD